MKNSTNEYQATVNVSTITKWMIGIGLVLLILPNCFSDEFVEQYVLLEAILGISNVIGSALFSAGLVSVIVEISTIKSLVSDAFTKILTGKFPVDGMNKELLASVKKRIIAEIFEVSEDHLDSGIYKYEKELAKLVKRKYYNYHKVTYHITPDSDKKCFHIKMQIEFCMINKYHEDNVFRLHFKLFKPNKDATLEESRNSVKVNFLKINKSDVSITENMINVLPIEHNKESQYYDYKLLIEKNLSAEKNSIVAELEHDVPIHDMCQSFKVSTPCKNIEHKFYIKKDISTGEEWMIKANAYSTFYTKQDDENSNFRVEQNIDTALIITYKDWALVGNGYCVFYQKKQ